MFLQFNRNTEQARVVDVMVARAKRINIFDDKSKQVVFFYLFSFTCRSSGENESFLVLPNFHSCFSNLIEIRYMFSISYATGIMRRESPLLYIETATFLYIKP